MYDPGLLTLEGLLQHYFPGAAGYGIRVGQYRSQIFPHSEPQAERIRDLAAQFAVPLAEPGSPESVFWSAEDYHQKYGLRRNTELVAAMDDVLGSNWDEHVYATKLNAVGEGGFDIQPWLSEMAPEIVSAFGGRVLTQ